MLRRTQAIGAEEAHGLRLFLRRTRSRLGRVNAIGLWPIAAESPDRTAAIEPGGAAVTYAALAREADRYGRGFQGRGPRPGALRATLLPNGVTALGPCLAARDARPPL